ncbi:MAG: FumA C-terminus/TtdB family hydratase beta subunit [Sphaerochaetaceae bacterium]|jgi:fumarate hydratase subunit beta|nr:FumA C-terminus/TtdB family hydratase beta subunit [Sphaerochaetaceae bacterium]HHU88453.1 TRZ/ATZ family protein [Spirochaetales bacterium]
MRKIDLPMSRETIESLKAYDRILLSGEILVGRDQVHARLAALINEGKPLPISLEGEVIYYMAPAATPPSFVIGSCGPTTSARMDPFTPTLMGAGLVASIGKGPRSQAVVEAVKANKGLYLVAFGGCGALYATKVLSKEVIAFEDLGPEAVMRLKVEEFPVIVGIDSRGASVF